MNLYDLTNAYLRIQELIESGEDYSGILETLDDEIETKADGYARIIRNMEGSIEAIKAEQARLDTKKKQLENGIIRLKENLKMSMIATGKTKFKTDLFSFSIAKNGGATPVVLDVDVDKLPKRFVVISKKPDLKAIASYLAEKPKAKIAHFGERGESLRIK